MRARSRGPVRNPGYIPVGKPMADLFGNAVGFVPAANVNISQ